MYCALFFLRTQDIVSAGVKDTPMDQVCQMPGELNADQQKIELIIYNHSVTIFQTFLTLAVSPGRKAEIRANAGFRFVANQKNRGEDEFCPGFRWPATSPRTLR